MHNNVIFNSRKIIWFLITLILPACNSDGIIANNKDLDQNMMDIRAYQENLGDEIKSKILQDASWLLDGMDNILHILNKRFKEHCKLSDPFSYFYRKRLQLPIEGIRKAIVQNDTARALSSYRLLVKRCYNRHVDNDIDKEVKFCPPLCNFDLQMS